MTGGIRTPLSLEYQLIPVDFCVVNSYAILVSDYSRVSFILRVSTEN